MLPSSLTSAKKDNILNRLFTQEWQVSNKLPEHANIPKDSYCLLLCSTRTQSSAEIDRWKERVNIIALQGQFVILQPQSKYKLYFVLDAEKYHKFIEPTCQLYKLYKKIIDSGRLDSYEATWLSNFERMDWCSASIQEKITEAKKFLHKLEASLTPPHSPEIAAWSSQLFPPDDPVYERDGPPSAFTPPNSPVTKEGTHSAFSSPNSPKIAAWSSQLSPFNSPVLETGGSPSPLTPPNSPMSRANSPRSFTGRRHETQQLQHNEQFKNFVL
ncbi:hypothetical protein [Rickettsiales endosymbiont of Stachyamoeba lipophora]|uniref:hypothetical protein n=1 Tax=Rickettsiales endosymbiont of Stachyamoeba lipophora TaxID=2486578 RepID=UPI000F64D4D4|nr:hypothetical protein [Rickettsiales endosymbiont of Stachyamoeba lipophora]AZL15848.1 hypothetical protein EF513_04730 [Rickettsiales endosymbiont of Stachyamoeba lipophora]